jgi:pyrimidine operon attenuation protein / uracil phosphoribosyltransferase
MKKNIILDSDQIHRKLQRIAREFLEAHHSEKELILIGIEGQGLEMASRLHEIVKSISQLNVRFGKMKLNKKAPLNSEVVCSFSKADLKNKVVIVIDDVLYSGKTLIYAVKHILDSEPKGVYTTVLVDRIHRSFPIHADYFGLTLSTNHKENITVNLSQSGSSIQEAVYLDA